MTQNEDTPAPGLGQRIRALREQRGVSAASLSKKAGLNPVSLYRIEKGQAARPHDTTLKNLAKHLQTTPEYLLYGDVTEGGLPMRGTMPDIPWSVAMLLCTARMGVVTPDELLYLVKQSRDGDRVRTPDDLEIELLTRRALHSRRPEAERALSDAFDRQRRERESGFGNEPAPTVELDHFMVAGGGKTALLGSPPTTATTTTKTTKKR